MQTEKIIIANLKCGGCESTIIKNVKEMAGVNSVTVSQEEDAVSIDYNSALTRSDFTKKLLSLGYPEATQENGLLLQLKSYVSCMVGRANNLVK